MDLIAIPDFAAGKIGDSSTKERIQISADGVLKTVLLCEQVSMWEILSVREDYQNIFVSLSSHVRQFMTTILTKSTY